MPSCDNEIVDYSGKKLSEGNVQECVQQLRELLDADKKFQNFRKDDAYLLRFLHCTDFCVHLAYRRVDDYYSVVLEYPEWFASGSPLQHKSLIDQNTKLILPDVRDKQGRRIFIAKLGDIDPSRMSPQENAHVDEFWLELVMDEPKTQAAGISIIMDLKNYSWRMLRWLTPFNIRIGSKKADLYPCKELVYHVVNTSMFINASIKLVWPFLTAKIKEKFHFHFADWESLHKFIDPKILPPEYGGTGPELDFNKLNQWLYDNEFQIAGNLRHHEVKKY